MDTGAFKRHVGLIYFFTLFLLFTHLILPTDCPAQSSNLTIGNYVKLSEKRISRTVYEYTYRASITNTGPAVKNVTASLTSISPYTSVIDGALTFGNVGAGEIATSSDTFTIRHDRLYPFNWSNLNWDIAFEPAKTEIIMDEARRVTSLIPLEGGMLSTVGADGTTFTLNFPPGSLLQPTEITLAPALSVSGLPLKGTVLAAVQMGPQGLKFGTHASLSIEFLTPPAIQNLLVGFLFQDDGTDFYLVPASLAANKATFQIDHFTGGGLMEITDEEFLNFAINAYYGKGGILDTLSAVNSCGGKPLDNAIAKTINFLKLVEIVPDIPFDARPCIYPGGGKPCTSIFDLGEAARESLENVIRNLFVEADNQCKSDRSKEAEAIKCIAAAQRFEILFITPLFDETLWGMKTCGLASLEIRPREEYLAVNESTMLEVITRDKSGNQLFGREMLWMSDDESIASLSPVEDTALVTGKGEGKTFINVYDKMSSDLGVIIGGFNWDQAVITVFKPRVTVQPDRATIGIGGMKQLTATVTDSAGNPYTGCTLAWYSSNVNVADVNPFGLVTGIAEGQANITAVCDQGIGVAATEVLGVIYRDFCYDGVHKKFSTPYGIDPDYFDSFEGWGPAGSTGSVICDYKSAQGALSAWSWGTYLGYPTYWINGYCSFEKICLAWDTLVIVPGDPNYLGAPVMITADIEILGSAKTTVSNTGVSFAQGYLNFSWWYKSDRQYFDGCAYVLSQKSCGHGGCWEDTWNSGVASIWLGGLEKDGIYIGMPISLSTEGTVDAVTRSEYCNEECSANAEVDFSARWLGVTGVFLYDPNTGDWTKPLENYRIFSCSGTQYK